LVVFETFEIIIERFLIVTEKNLHEAGNISAGFQPEVSLPLPRTAEMNFLSSSTDPGSVG
jgi:hypothetical protein